MALLDEDFLSFDNVWEAVRRDKNLKPVPAVARDGIKSHVESKMPLLRLLVSSRREMQEVIARLVCSLYRLTETEIETVSSGGGVRVL
jgi:hypothetical protein